MHVIAYDYIGAAWSYCRLLIITFPSKSPFRQIMYVLKVQEFPQYKYLYLQYLYSRPTWGRDHFRGKTCRAVACVYEAPNITSQVRPYRARVISRLSEIKPNKKLDRAWLWAYAGTLNYITGAYIHCWWLRIEKHLAAESCSEVFSMPLFIGGKKLVQLQSQMSVIEGG